ncbi:MAG: DUF5683 domain-containing protein [Bacteroidales bacterium]
MNLKCFLLVGVFFVFLHCVNAQTADSTLDIGLSVENVDIRADSYKYKKSPTTASLYSAILPGLGQIYNEAYWKVPLVYGLLGSMVYVVYFNDNQYKLYRQSYLDLTDADPNTRYYENIASWQWMMQDEQNFASRLNIASSSARRNRDYMIIWTVVAYLAQIIDASVDAHLFDFDDSESLSYRFSPSPIVDPASGKCYPGLNFALTF